MLLLVNQEFKVNVTCRMVLCKADVEYTDTRLAADIIVNIGKGHTGSVKFNDTECVNLDMYCSIVKKIVKNVAGE